MPILRSALLWVRPGVPRSSTKLTTLRAPSAAPSSSLQMNTTVSA